MKKWWRHTKTFASIIWVQLQKKCKLQVQVKVQFIRIAPYFYKKGYLIEVY